MSDTIWWPGATRSGFWKPSYQVGPRDEYHGMLSSLRVAVPFMSSDPTVMADGALPGEFIPAYPTSCVVGSPPLFPADTTTTMPAATACSTACTSGSLAAGSYTGWPSDMLMTSMPSVALFFTAKLTAFTTQLV